MQKLETRNGTLVFVEVPENATYNNHLQAHEKEFTYKIPKKTVSILLDFHPLILGEVTKKEIPFDCKLELTEGNKFVVLKEKTK